MNGMAPSWQALIYLDMSRPSGLNRRALVSTVEQFLLVICSILSVANSDVSFNLLKSIP